jgi:NAD+ diphosphatase
MSRAAGELPSGALFLGQDDEAAYFTVLEAGVPDDGRPASEVTVDLRTMGAQLSDRDAGLMVHAVALTAWHRTHPHCPRCGTATEIVQGGAARRCPNDDSEHYPRCDPAMIVLVQSADGQRVVLGRGRTWPERRFSVLAGFVEPGESVEQAVAREVTEEVGLVVRDIVYTGSQAWPFPSSLMLSYTATAVTERLTVAPGELAEACWFSAPELRAAVAAGQVILPGPSSIARRMIDEWLSPPVAGGPPVG